ncbi:amino acid ABC transporter substrate-binding protein [Pseudomonas sp. RTB3]|uniref:amino acid ABC transporter substrate-binding protein n=1 Tax=unclassified Pseudomonas TaxID=196821 RepID=UPI002B22D229|nr:MULTISPECIES: amino acid ABC transporter substrate-binding protein [unclassified Pseudomonas]MEB0006692.1 amino acid ABC transporter substrate-binding protein [Pseudomonas sp. RTB2]MEB0016030.1 amino acid ABC transporter substrate-binding protein [Pseudomonas sp. RTB3]MEB0270532.1 amino acid ABC transporter substrate-binding protein [Pseudomonas sp. 5B4]
MKQRLLNGVTITLLCLAGMTPLQSSADTLSRIRGSSAINLGYLPNASPFTSNVDGKASGYAIELCNLIAERVKAQTQLSSLAIHYVEVAEGNGLDDVRQGKIDLLCTPGVETLAARKSVSFSVPVFTAGLTAVVSKDAPNDLIRVLNGEVAHSGPTWRGTINQGLSHHTYVVMVGGVTEQWIHERIKTLGVIADVITVKNFAEGIDLIARKKASAFFADRRVLLSYAAKSNAANELQVLDTLYDFAPIAMAVDRQDEDFRLMVDSALSSVYRSGEILNIYAKYFGGTNEVNAMLFKLYALP